MADKNKGWFKIERSQWESEVLRDNEERFAWADMMSLFQYQDEDLYLKKTHKTVTIYAGQMFTSARHLSSRWAWQRGRVERFISRLNRANWIAIERDTNGTIITLLNTSENATVRANKQANTRANKQDTDRDTDRANNRATERACNKNIRTNKDKTSKELKNAPSAVGGLGGIWKGDPE